MVKSPKAFCNILNVSATEISFRKQNFLDNLAESTALPAAFHSKNNDFCGR